MLNHITIMGRLVKDPEMRTTQSGVSVASFTLAVDRDFSGKDGAEKQTDFIDCTATRFFAPLRSTAARSTVAETLAIFSVSASISFSHSKSVFEAVVSRFKE